MTSEYIKSTDEQKNNGYFFARSDAYMELLNFIDSMTEEPASEDLEEYYKKEFLPNEWFAKPGQRTISEFNFFTAKHFAEWQKQKDEKLFNEDTWNYIEEQYPDVTKEEKLRLYDVSIKSRLAGANTIKQQMKGTIQKPHAR